MARIDIELFELAVDLCADLMTEGVPAPVAMKAQRKIQAFAEAHATKRKRDRTSARSAAAPNRDWRACHCTSQ
jgi:hypothetical protein